MTAIGKKQILVINGPNLNLLGKREPDIYGSETLADIENKMKVKAEKSGYTLEFCQTNIEGEIINWIQDAHVNSAGIILNAGAYTHSSVAIMDALKAQDLPVIEVHLSNIFKREEFRHHSFISPASVGVICGFGSLSYMLALDALDNILGNQ